jgi:hypothetical protein
MPGGGFHDLKSLDDKLIRHVEVEEMALSGSRNVKMGRIGT